MLRAAELARNAELAGNVAVGSVIVLNGQAIAEAGKGFRVGSAR